MGGFEEIEAGGARTAPGVGIRTDLPSAEGVRAELQRLLGSVTFTSARAQRKFLQYTVNETLEGRGPLLKEFTLGVEVFGRGQSFDPRTHNIVRVEASKLRAKLTRYYATEGRGNPLRIEFPKGSYAPVFHRHEPPDSPDERAPDLVQLQPAAPTELQPWMRRHFRIGVLVAALTLLMV